MAVAFDAVGPSSAGTSTASGTSLSWSHTCSGTERLLTASVCVANPSASTLTATLTVTYNGTGMVSAGKMYSNNVDAGFVELFYVVAPSTGSNTVAVSCTETMTLIGGSVSFTGVDQTSPISGAVTNSGNDAFPGVTVSSRAGDMVVDGICCGSSITSADQTQRWNNNLNNLSGAGNGAQSTSAGAASVTMGYNMSGTDFWGMVAMNVRAVRTVTPPLVAAYNASYNSTVAAKTLSVTTQPGDLLVVYGAGADATSTLTTPSGNGVSFTLQQSVLITNFSATYMWTGVDATGGAAWTLSCTSSAGDDWGFSCLVFRGMGGVGTSVKTNGANSTPLLNITTTGKKSSLVVFITDWNANNGASRLWRPINSIAPSEGNDQELSYHFENSIYTIYGAYYSDVANIGTKITGLAVPGSQNFAIIALEVLAQSTVASSPVAWLQ